MKKIIAVTMVALLMLAMATSAFAIVTETSASYKNPPVFISGMTVSDAWMSGLTSQNWAGSLTNQAYAEGSYIWFIARISVAANGDTDAQHLWDARNNMKANATLTITGKDNCLNLTSANMATLAQISGMNVVARQIQNNNLGIVEATENKAKFVFTTTAPAGMDENGVLLFTENLAKLQLDGIYPKNIWYSNAWGLNAAAFGTTVNTAAGWVANRATNQKDYYLHFMGITKSATEGVCIGTMKVNGEDTFKRVGQMYPDASYSTISWWATPSSVTSDTQLKAGDRSGLYLLYNTVNGKQYSIMKISNEAVAPNSVTAPSNTATDPVSDTARAGQQVPGFTNARGPYTNEGVMYVLMNKEADKVVCAFVVDGTYRGLAQYDKKAQSSTEVPFSINGSGANAGFYMPVMSNDLSAAVVQLNGAYNGYSISTSELQAIFDFFGFAYANSSTPTDADFLARSGLVTVAEAKYNVANAVITTPDTTVVIPKTGDAATSTGLILVASAILAAAAVGFVLSKRAHN